MRAGAGWLPPAAVTGAAGAGFIVLEGGGVPVPVDVVTRTTQPADDKLKNSATAENERVFFMLPTIVKEPSDL
ncbi:MAG: hypothetical protein SF187_27115 [Deltaproteobacteria bacterium]|nr:hypothetical protein [Deltaproteobacteria bacterium]